MERGVDSVVDVACNVCTGLMAVSEMLGVIRMVSLSLEGSKVDKRSVSGRTAVSPRVSGWIDAAILGVAKESPLALASPVALTLPTVVLLVRIGVVGR